MCDVMLECPRSRHCRSDPRKSIAAAPSPPMPPLCRWLVVRAELAGSRGARTRSRLASAGAAAASLIRNRRKRRSCFTVNEFRTVWPQAVASAAAPNVSSRSAGALAVSSVETANDASGPFGGWKHFSGAPARTRVSQALCPLLWLLGGKCLPPRSTRPAAGSGRATSRSVDGALRAPAPHRSCPATASRGWDPCQPSPACRRRP